MAGMNKCVGCGRSITANQKYVEKHGKLFHTNCLDMFLESDKGKEWEEKFLRSKAGQEEEIDELLEKIERYGMSDSDKIRDDLNSSIADDGDEEAYEHFKDKLREYESAFWEFVRQKREKEEREEQQKRELRQEYDTVFKQVKSLIKNTTFYENDENKIKDYLASIEYKVNETNKTKLEKIAALDFQSADEPKNGLIIVGVILIISVSLLPLGIILLIIGLSKKNKAKKAMEEAARNNFALVKKIMYAKSENASIEDDSDKTVEEMISELYASYIEQEFDSDTAEQTIFAQSNESEIKKATESFNISSDEKILFGYDDTLKKSFKTGFVLTDKKLYFTDGNSFSKNISISVFDINKISFKKKLGVFYILINDSCISITSPIGQDSEKLCEILNKSVKILQKGN
ncbi:MAG: hypothetical protein IJJ71_04420 [Treponema sp.]|uniref:LIM domain-containing protein n=1 Tax=Treponema sp. TaxID=166 RepID=UPI0025EC1970|nr:LIM domain-containing protein [Treponema sp.]MBR0495406.1 hypothetical protein [Treponema sp.]